MSGTITNYLVGLLTVSMFVIGFSLWYGDVASSYEITDAKNITGEDYLGVEEGSDNPFLVKSQQLKASVDDNLDEEEDSLFGITGFLLPFQLVLDSLSATEALVTGGIQAVDEFIPIGWVQDYLLAIITIIIIFAIISAVLKTKV